MRTHVDLSEKRTRLSSMIRRVWHGRVSLGAAFWLWGLLGNAIYVVLFLVWPIKTIKLIGEERPLGIVAGGIFVIVSQTYMLFSFVFGMRAARNQAQTAKGSAMLALLAASLLLVTGELLWCVFTFYWLLESLTREIWSH